MNNQNYVAIKGARTHNLKNLSLTIPKKKVVIFTGVSGSGKSSLVFDTIYTEAQRQLVETFSSFARRRLPKLSRPDVDEISNISTAIIIDQKRMGSNMRSVVGTATEINSYLRLLYSRCGDKFIGPSFYFGFNHPEGMCKNCKGLGKKIEIDANLMINWTKSIREGAINHPDFKVGGWNWREMMAIELFDVDKKIENFSKEELNNFLRAKGIPVQKNHGAGIYTKNYEGVISRLERLYLNKAQEELSSARRNAYNKYFVSVDCRNCNGSRLNERARSVVINKKNIAEISEMELTELDAFLSSVEGDVAKPLVIKIRQILSHLIEIGVGYLSLNREVSTLSGGESQRVKMARQLDCNLVDMIYVLDEPSIGLHAKDVEKLIQMLFKLKDKGNSVFVVEHDPEIIKTAEWIIDIGPRAGINGGNLIYSGNYEELLKSEGITGKFLTRKNIRLFNNKVFTDFFELHNVNANNLKNISVKIPKGALTCVSGVAGSGKSSLIHHCFVKKYKDSIVVDQNPIMGSIRSNPATFIGVFDYIRKEFALASNAEPSLFSFNSKGACPKCKGKGYIEMEMSFLDDIKLLCDDCEGRRYTDEALIYKYKSKNIYEILNMTVEQAANFFSSYEILKRLKILSEVGLDYLQLGQPLSTLSGGEAQRLKLAAELHKKGNIYIMDEPTTGLHPADIEKLINIINQLTQRNNTVIVIEHNLDIISKADWIIDLGPEGGSKGGNVIFEGYPKDLISCQNSFTGKYLNKFLK